MMLDFQMMDVEDRFFIALPAFSIITSSHLYFFNLRIILHFQWITNSFRLNILCNVHVPVLFSIHKLKADTPLFEYLRRQGHQSGHIFLMI